MDTAEPGDNKWVIEVLGWFLLLVLIESVSFVSDNCITLKSEYFSMPNSQ